MLAPILHKEIEKIRWPWLTLLVLNLLLMAVIHAGTRRMFMMDHAEIVWYRAIYLGRISFDALRFVPAITGALLACAQFLPEMRDERLRLSLHLPISPHMVVLGHVAVGLGATGLILVCDMIALAAGLSQHFPADVVRNSMLTALPWIIAGLAAYLGITQALLEPNFKLKAFNLAVATGITALFLKPVAPGAYGHVLPLLFPTVVLMIPAVLLPAYRFRYRSGS